jgi:hypothetical protein
MQVDPSSPPGLVPRERRLFGPVTLLVVGFLGSYLVSDGTFLGPDRVAPLLNPWLSGLVGPEGVHAARQFGVKLFALPIGAGFLWLVSLYPHLMDARTRRLLQAQKDQGTTFGFLLFFLFATVMTCLAEGPFTPGRLASIGVLLGMTVLSGFFPVRQVRRNRAPRAKPGASDPTAPPR